MTQLTNLQPIDAPQKLMNLQPIDSGPPANMIDALGSRLMPSIWPPAGQGPGEMIRGGLARATEPMVRALTATTAPGGPPGSEQPAFTSQDAATAALSPEAGRLALETAGATAGTALMPEVALPAAIAKYGPVVGRLIGAAVGGGAGSLASEPIDPSANPMQRAAIVAALSTGGEATVSTVGAGMRAGSRALANLVPDAKAAADAFVDQYLKGATREEVGALVTDSLIDSRDAFQATARAKYAAVDATTQGAKVDLQPALAAANDIMAKQPRNAAAEELRGRISDALARGEDGQVSFDAAQQLRSELLAARGTQGAGATYIPGQAEGAAKRLAGSVDAQMEAAANAAGPDALKAWRDANAFWKDGKQTFNSQMVRALSRAQPEEVFRIGVKNAKPEAVARLQQLVEPATWERVKGLAAHDLFSGASDATTGEISGSKLVTALSKNDGYYGPAKLNLLYGQDGAQQIMRIAKTLKRTQAADRALSLSWQNGLKIGTVGALGTFAGVGHTPLAIGAVLSLTPAATVKFVTRPGVARWLEIGLAAKPGSPLARRAFAQLATHAAELELDSQ